MVAYVYISYIFPEDGWGRLYNIGKIIRLGKSLLIFVFVISIEFYFSNLEECNLLYRRQPGQCSGCSDLLRDGRSGGLNPDIGEIFRDIHTGPEAHSAPCKMVTGAHPLKSGWSVALNTHPLLVTRLRMCWCYKTALLLCLHRHDVGWPLPFYCLYTRETFKSEKIELSLGTDREN